MHPELFRKNFAIETIFSLSMEELMEEQIRSTARKINIPLMKEVILLIKQILQGEYRNVGGRRTTAGFQRDM